MTDEPTEAARAAWRDGDLHNLVAAYRRGDLTAKQVMAADQQELAKDGTAIGQCQSCGSYRLDGQPPILHHPGCAETPPLTPFGLT